MEADGFLRLHDIVTGKVVYVFDQSFISQVSNKSGKWAYNNIPHYTSVHSRDTELTDHEMIQAMANAFN